MSEIWENLEKLGLASYADSLIAEGFDTWATLSDITESDLNDLKFKLGHRRKLQRAIAEHNRQLQGQRIPLPQQSLNTNEPDGSLRQSIESIPPQNVSKPSVDLEEPVRTKRKYRRHPKADVHAPERPPSAYVIFSNHMREILQDRERSFTEMAKCVGEKWQELPPDERERFERQASTVKEKYLSELGEYKKTENYRIYQEYLADFKAKNGKTESENKRVKLQPESSVSTQSSHDTSELGTARTKSGGSPYTNASTPPASEPPLENEQKNYSPPTSYYPKIQFPERRIHRYKTPLQSTSPPISTLPYNSIHEGGGGYPKPSTRESSLADRTRQLNHSGILAPYAAPLEPPSRLPPLTETTKPYTHVLLLNAPLYPLPRQPPEDGGNNNTHPGIMGLDAVCSRRILPAPVRTAMGPMFPATTTSPTTTRQQYGKIKDAVVVPPGGGLGLGLDDDVVRGSNSLAALLRAGEELAARDEGIVAAASASASASLDRSGR